MSPNICKFWWVNGAPIRVSTQWQTKKRGTKNQRIKYVTTTRIIIITILCLCFVVLSKYYIMWYFVTEIINHKHANDFSYFVSLHRVFFLFSGEWGSLNTFFVVNSSCPYVTKVHVLSKYTSFRNTLFKIHRLVVSDNAILSRLQSIHAKKITPKIFLYYQ